MLQQAYSQIDFREAAASTSTGGLPISVALSASAQIVSDTITVPFDEVWQVLYAGVSIQVDDVRLAPGISVTSTYAVVATTIPTFSTPLSRVPVVKFGATNALPADRMVPVPMSVTTVAGGPGGLWYFGSMQLSGVMLGPGDNVVAGVGMVNSDAGGAHNVTAFYLGVRFVPLKIVSEIAVANLVGQRMDTNLDRRLRNVRG